MRAEGRDRQRFRLDEGEPIRGYGENEFGSPLPLPLGLPPRDVVLGGLLGTASGIHFPIVYVRRALGVVLIVAGLKLIGVY